MIYKYGIRVKGVDHDKNNTPCQDAYEIIRCNDDMVIAAVADGLGSADFSDVASQIAVKISTNYCKEHVAQTDNTYDILRKIKTSFWEAQSEIEKAAETQEHDIVQYHTTLTLVVLIRDMLYFGHAGDSGIIALTVEGLYEKVTEQQRDEYGYVFPLFFESKWIFGQFDKKICSVLLATDGILLQLIPRLLKNEPVNIHINLAAFFIDNRKLRIDEQIENVVKTREDYVQNIPGEAVEGDDLTIVALVNTSIVPGTQPEVYYKEPDWAVLERKHDDECKRLLYPHLFNDDNSGAIKGSSVDETEKKNGVSVDSEIATVPMKKSETVEENDTSYKTELKPSKKQGFFGRFFGK